MNVREIQEQLCGRLSCIPNFVEGSEELGVSPSTFSSEWPFTGVRHLPAGGTCGWYIWVGEYSEDDGFFQSQHAEHLFAARPEIAKYLGLPPGWGFIVAPGFEDVWQDDGLLVD